MARAWLEPNEHPERVADWGMTIEFMPSDVESGGESHDGALTTLLSQAVRDDRVAEINVWSHDRREFIAYERRTLQLLAVTRTDNARKSDDSDARWGAYRQTLAHRELDPILIEALLEEPDPALVIAVVLDALEAVAADQRLHWVGMLPDGVVRGFAAKRAHDLALFERLLDPDIDTVDQFDAIDSWSPWLQRQAVEHTPHREVLDRLAVTGATKQIRHRAHQRSRKDD